MEAGDRIAERSLRSWVGTDQAGDSHWSFERIRKRIWCQAKHENANPNTRLRLRRRRPTIVSEISGKSSARLAHRKGQRLRMETYCHVSGRTDSIHMGRACAGNRQRFRALIQT